MTINTIAENGNVTIKLAGRLDSVTAPELEKELNGALMGAKTLVFDFNRLEYISSAGLRVLLKAQNVMNTRGRMTVTGVNDMIMEIFDITGFSDVLTIR